MGQGTHPQINTQQALTPPTPKVGNKGSCTGITKIDYCTEYATIKCSQSSHFLKLTVMPGMNRPTFGPYKHRGASITDCVPELNFPLFRAPWNLCFSLLNPLVLAATTAKFAATGTWSTVPQPCCLGHVPIGVWGKSVGEMKLKYVPYTGVLDNVLSFRNFGVFFKSNPETDCLTKNCTLTCAWLGTISITSSGRDEMNPAPYDPITGLIGPSVFDCLRNACGMIMNYTGMKGTIALAALDSVFAGLQTGFDSGDALEGIVAGLKTVAIYAAGFVIAAGAGAAGAKLMKTGAGVRMTTKITAKFNSFAQSNLVKSINKLSYNVHTGSILIGQVMQANKKKTSGKFLEWMGRRNLNRVMDGRKNLLTQIGANELDKRIAMNGRLEATLKGKYEHLDALQQADISRKAQINDELSKAIDDQKVAYDIRDELTDNSPFKDVVNDKIAKNHSRIDQLAEESVRLDEQIARRNETMGGITDDRDILNHAIDRDTKIRDGLRDEGTGFGEGVAARNDEIVTIGREAPDDYNKSIDAAYRIGKIDEEVASIDKMKADIDPAPDTKGDKFLNRMQQSETKGRGKAIEDGRAGSAPTMATWGADAIATESYQNFVSGSDDSDFIEYDIGNMNYDPRPDTPADEK